MWRDPVTGDEMTRGEHASWLVMGWIRRWSWTFALTILTLVWIWQPGIFGDDATYARWMVLFSWLAVEVESIVGQGTYGQMRRDAVVLRKVLNEQKSMRAEVAQVLAEVLALREAVLDDV